MRAYIYRTNRPFLKQIKAQEAFETDAEVVNFIIREYRRMLSSSLQANVYIQVPVSMNRLELLLQAVLDSIKTLEDSVNGMEDRND